MKKLLVIFIVSFLYGQTASAQIRIALVGGPHSATIKETNNTPGWDTTTKNGYSSRGGFHAGFIADIQLSYSSKFYFQPGIVYYNKGRKFSQRYDTLAYGYYLVNKKQYLNYIDFPLNLVYKYPINAKTKLFAGAGPYLSFFYNGKETSETYKTEAGIDKVITNENTDLPVGKGPGKYKTTDFGANATAGIEFGRIFLSVNFSRGISNFYQPSGYKGNYKHQVFGGTLGIFLGPSAPLEKKIRDKDKDGVVDEDDMCPDEPGTAATKGCPDRDADGTADIVDNCPDVAGLVKYNGCPIPDTDGDGVNDEEDQCKTVAGLAKYKGCPVPDTDGDGINDENDKCPDVAGLVKYNGCPIPDTDADGVNDEEDKCPTEAGVKENNGCPAIKEDIKKQVEYTAKKIKFKTGSAELEESTKDDLDEIVKMLIENPELTMDVEGHASSDGNAALNQKLSEERAQSVKAYLAEKGVDETKLSAKGFGSSQPLNGEKTPEERIQNRRVELKLSNSSKGF